MILFVCCANLAVYVCVLSCLLIQSTHDDPETQVFRDAANMDNGEDVHHDYNSDHPISRDSRSFASRETDF